MVSKQPLLIPREEEFEPLPLNRLISVEGTMGAGKSTVATWWSFRDWMPKHYVEENGKTAWLICKSPFKEEACPYCAMGIPKLEGKKIFTNYHTLFSEYLTLETFIDRFEDPVYFYNCDIVFDEIHQMGDRRRAMSGLNFALDKFMKQTRKRGVDVIFCVQRFKDLDDRLQWSTQYRCICTRDEKSPLVNVAMRRQRTNEVTYFTVDVRAVKNLYDTNETLELPPGMLKIKAFEKDKKERRIKKEAEKELNGVRL